MRGGGCDPGHDERPPATADVGSLAAWYRVVSVADAEQPAEVAGAPAAPPDAGLRFEGGRFGTVGGCPGGSGDVTVVGTRLEVVSVTTPAIGCPDDPRTRWDDWFRSFLAADPSLELADDTMTLRSVGPPARVVVLEETEAPWAGSYPAPSG
jgi:hypothetical protein